MQWKCLFHLFKLTAKQRFTIMENETVNKQLVRDDLSFKVNIENADGNQQDDIG